jgi:hypothetical protein
MVCRRANVAGAALTPRRPTEYLQTARDDYDETTRGNHVARGRASVEASVTIVTPMNFCVHGPRRNAATRAAAARNDDDGARTAGEERELDGIDK